jgi:hypothetical protein
MIKIAVAELEQALQLIKSTSHDMHIIVREDAGGLHVQFQNVDNQMSVITIYDENMRSFAKVSATENLGQVLTRLKKEK